MNAPKAVTIDLNKGAVLEKVSRMFTQTPESVLLEILQNARRAGAKNAEVWLLGDRVMISNDGRPLTQGDWAAMFNLGSSSWEGDVMTEDPAGCGFFIASLYDRIILASRPGDGTLNVLRADRESLTKIGREIPVETKPNDGLKWSTSITLVGGGPDITEAVVEEVASRLDMRIRLKSSRDGYGPDQVGECRNFDEWAAKGLRSKGFVGPELTPIGETENVRWYRCAWTMEHKASVIINYHGHLIKLDREVMKAYSGSEAGVHCIYAKVDGPVGLKMVLPGRDSVIKDEAFDEFVLLARKINGDWITKLRGGHKMYFRGYEYVRETNPDLPEAVVPGWAKDLQDNEHAIAVSYPNDMLSSFLLHHPGVKCEKVHGMDEYVGYSWMEPLLGQVYMDAGAQMKYRLDDDVIVPQTRVNLDGDHEFDPHENANGSFIESERIQILGHDDRVLLEPSALVVDQYMDASWARGGWFDSSSVGVYWNPRKGTTPEKRKKIAEELEALVDELWESSDDIESDNWETQQSFFQEEFLPWLYSSLCPEESLRNLQGGLLRGATSSTSAVISLDDGNYGVRRGRMFYGEIEHMDTPKKRVRRVNRKEIQRMSASELFMELSALDLDTLRVMVDTATE